MKGARERWRGYIDLCSEGRRRVREGEKRERGRGHREENLAQFCVVKKKRKCAACRLHERGGGRARGPAGGRKERREGRREGGKR